MYKKKKEKREKEAEIFLIHLRTFFSKNFLVQCRKKEINKNVELERKKDR